MSDDATVIAIFLAVVGLIASLFILTAYERGRERDCYEQTKNERCFNDLKGNNQ